MLGSLRQMELILALDAGTTGVRTVAFDRAAQPVASAYRELTQFFPEPGWVEHDAAEIADLAVATLREVATHAHDHGHKVVAIGITNQRETTVAFDRETGHLAHRAIVWQDRRSAPYCEQLERGGLLLWVNVRNAVEEETALEILRAHSAHDVHAHEIAG